MNNNTIFNNDGKIVFFKNEETVLKGQTKEGQAGLDSWVPAC